MADSGLDPFFAPARLVVVTPDGANGSHDSTGWSYPGVESIAVEFADLESVRWQASDLAVLHPAVSDRTALLKALDELSVQAVLLPEGGEGRATGTGAPLESHSSGSGVAIDSDSSDTGTALYPDSSATDTALHSHSSGTGSGLQSLVADLDIRVMGPGSSIRMPADVSNGSTTEETAIVCDDPAVARSLEERASSDGVSMGPVVGVGAGFDVGAGAVIRVVSARPETDLGVGQTGRVNADFVREVRRSDPDTPIGIHPNAGGPIQGPSGIEIPGSRVVSELLHQSGVVHATSLDRMVDGAPALAGQPTPDPESVVVVSNAGGPGVMAIDAVGASGLEVATLSERTIERLEAVVPEHGSVHNPLDLLADSDIGVFETVLDAVLEDPAVGSAVVISAPSALFTFEDLATIIAETAARHDAPVVTALMGGERTATAADILRESGIPNYFDPYRAVDALDLLGQDGRVRTRRRREPDADGQVSAVDVEQYLHGSGQVTLKGAEAREFVEGVGVESLGAQSENGVEMHVSGFESVRGPLVTAGVGKFVTALGDVSVRASPLSRDDAMKMLSGLRASPLLEGARGQAEVNTEPLEDLLVGVSRVLANSAAVGSITFPGLEATADGLQVPAVEIRSRG